MQKLAEIPSGTVHMHDARRSESRTVPLRSFRIGVHPVTIAEYQPVVPSNGATASG